MFKYRKIGEILKPFRVEGELLALVDALYWKDLEKAKALFIETNGSKVPFFIEHIEDDGELLYIKLEEFSNPEEIKKYNGYSLFLREMDLTNAKNIKLDNNILDYAGFSISDKNSGQKLTILKTEQYPNQLMAIALVEEKEVLVPLIDEFIENIDFNKKEIIMFLPDGLLS